MKYALRFASLVVLAALTLSACGKSASTVSSSTPVGQPALGSSASPVVPSLAASATPSPSVTASTTDGQVYKQKGDLFEITFPKGYTYQETGSGLAFVSGDQGFGGSVDFGAAQGNKLTTEQLEKALKDEYEKRLKELKWQETKQQPDGSIRVDWTGKDPQGNALDAVSFVEQRGDTIYILNLFGVNKSYQAYNSDAEKIVSSYRVKQ